MRLLTEDFDSEFARLMEDNRIDRVDIASAWVTDGPGLDALERAAKTRSVKVRALVGINGRHTTPTALERLCKLGKVRLVDGGNLFHVKLYLFQSGTTLFAWIGSANFTRGGFKSNEELLVETTDTDEAVAWFGNRWNEIDPTQSRKQLREYCRTWKPPAWPRLDIDPDEDWSPPKYPWIVFVQEGERPPPPVEGANNKRWPARGWVEVAGKSIRYESAQEAVVLVFTELQRRDKDFLPRCGEDSRFGTRARRFVARTRQGLGSKANQKYAKELGDGWWMSTQTQTREKWNLIEWGAAVAGLRVDVEGEGWQAESKTNVRVGF